MKKPDAQKRPARRIDGVSCSFFRGGRGQNKKRPNCGRSFGVYKDYIPILLSQSQGFLGCHLSDMFCR